jgi:hypothetical protein
MQEAESGIIKQAGSEVEPAAFALTAAGPQEWRLETANQAFLNDQTPTKPRAGNRDVALCRADAASSGATRRSQPWQHAMAGTAPATHFQLPPAVLARGQQSWQWMAGCVNPPANTMADATAAASARCGCRQITLAV